ncbi:disulfide bond formation protein B [Legionella pneumophila]|uniref:disulfide bond formation protein B n=1 Tax=Legionella pneumophila TaxID=446 RepID=UPI0005C83A2F|nr:disulfide bond formation protein B [Legionella pneumophila]HAT8816791.1 disulfide bond formation protein B [Legionella pneumophila subsp. pneumophila]MCZ4804392.1 disulfide bond formation protein B [Legionella pneumophila]MDW9180867.1 disulfide bond formation protein B [Legionella pneumophila]WAI79650.1 disulfide bond formation protein B [Legionella pneumophila]CZH54571.1 disulfide bond formation protein B [Legionella pneumophila]
MNKQMHWHLFGNTSGLLIICCLLILAFLDQFIFYELPCPICILQRICFVAVGLCFVMNLILGIRASHYGLMLLASLLGLSISVRQMYIHLTPGDPGYGGLIFGLHLYTWSAIIFLIIILLIAGALILDKGFMPDYKVRSKSAKVMIWVFFILILANGISTFLECGPHECPDNPSKYYLLNNN